MALHFRSTIKTFPPQKQRPLHPLPPPPSSPAQPTRRPRCRSSTFSAIASWAANVQPGSPASPSPCRRLSLRKNRCPSITSVRGPYTPTTAFVLTPSVRDFKADLTAVGYTSVFLRFPDTPISATLPLSIIPSSPKAANNIPAKSVLSPTRKPRSLARFRSLTVLRSRGRSKPACPTTMMPNAAATSATVVKRKKAKYAMRPPPLANELALMQFTDGGGMDSNIKRIVEAQAKVTGAVGLADIYRDAEGGIWWDQDEQWEYTHLLAELDESRPHATGDLHWVTFDRNMSPSATDVIGEDRRGSMSTQDSDLDPKYVVHPTDSLDGDDLALLSSAIVPTRKRTASVLSVPSRPRRAAQHLRKPDLLVDVAFPRPYTSPKSLKFQTSPGVAAKRKLKEKARRRPAPLMLSLPTPGSKQPTNSPIDTEKVRRDFIAASFEPVDSIPVIPTRPVDMHARLIGNSRAINVPWPSLGVKKRSSMLNMMGLFRSARKEDMMC